MLRVGMIDVMHHAQAMQCVLHVHMQCDASCMAALLQYAP